MIALTVSDTGIGIEKSMQNTIFEAFAQADGTTAREYGGTGLGLSISRDLVGLLGGELTLSSEPGSGSAFTVYLPLESANGSAQASNPMVPVAAVAEQLITPEPIEDDEPEVSPTSPVGEFLNGTAAGSTVLVVDDDFRNVFALTALLERGKINVVAADGGAEALSILDQRDDIDLILMDIMMPVMNGYETMTEIRSRPKMAEIPIIAVTGKVIGGERERCIAAGASDYIPKPVDSAELLTALGQWFPVNAEVLS